MVRNFREDLDSAIGVSEFVLALNLDIRGFTNWSLEVDSAQTALYVKKVYAKLIDRYFADAAMVKPTGDGLFVVESFDEEHLESNVQRSVLNSLEIVETFGSLCDDEPMINFPVPQDVGIGLSRGSACRLLSGDLTLDYSGRVLNLAARLMGLARPRGLVFDEGLGVDLLPTDLLATFSKDNVYLRGASPTDPIAIYYRPQEIEISEINKHPIGETRWEQTKVELTPKDMEEVAQNWRFELDPQPIENHEAQCQVSHSAVTKGGRKSASRTTYVTVPVAMGNVAGKKVARVNINKLAADLKQNGVGPSWPVQIIVSYRSM
jgi:hypothetical protein